jgi:hypothetical protein
MADPPETSLSHFALPGCPSRLGIGYSTPAVHWNPRKKYVGRAVDEYKSAYLLQNLGEGFEQFRPGPSREELNQILNLPK